MIVDFHVHLLKCDWVQPWVAEWLAKQVQSNYKPFVEKYGNPEYFVSLLKESGVDYAVVLAEYAPATTGLASNESVWNFCRNYHNLIPFCSINPYLIGQGAKEVKRLVIEKDFRGIKLYPTYNYFYPNDHIMYPIYSVAEELKIPVIFHTGTSIFHNSRIKYGNPLLFDDIAVDFPGLSIIMAHSGRGCWYREAFLMAQMHQNIYMEISGLPVKKLPVYFPELERIRNKVIFGSDYPGLPTSIKQNINDFKDLNYSEDTKRLILGDTAAFLLNLKYK